MHDEKRSSIKLIDKKRTNFARMSINCIADIKEPRGPECLMLLFLFNFSINITVQLHYCRYTSVGHESASEWKIPTVYTSLLFFKAHLSLAAIITNTWHSTLPNFKISFYTYASRFAFTNENPWLLLSCFKFRYARWYKLGQIIRIIRWIIRRSVSKVHSKIVIAYM